MTRESSSCIQAHDKSIKQVTSAEREAAHAPRMQSNDKGTKRVKPREANSKSSRYNYRTLQCAEIVSVEGTSCTETGTVLIVPLGQSNRLFALVNCKKLVDQNTVSSWR